MVVAAWAGLANSAAAVSVSASASAIRRLRRIRGCSAIFACSAPPPRGASAITGSARPTPNPSPIARPSCGSPSATLIPASAHTAKLRMKVVKPSPSSTP